MKKLNVALVGLSFGLEFVAIYCKHPDIDKVYIVDKNEKLLNIAKERYSIPDERCFTDLQDVLDIPEIDAVHLVTPPATHAPFSVRVLNAGKHCGCTIPMGMSIQELNDIIAARKASGKNYMFMETTIFQREFLYIQELYKKGELGRLQYMTCAHYQDMEGWPEYWEGFPPLMHPTHAVAPCLMLAGHLPDKVYARGSGKIRKELADKYGCPFAFESAFISLQDSDVTIEMERFLYGVARNYSECFRIYGENESFEWQQLADEDPVLFTRTGELEKVDILDEDSEKSSRGSEIVEKNESRSRIMHTFFRRKSHPSPPTQYITMRTPISPLPRVGVTVVPIHTLYMNSFVPFWKNVNLLLTTSWVLTGQVQESVRTNPL